MNIPELDPDYCIEKQIFRHSRKSHVIYLTALVAVFVALLSLPFLYVDIVVHGVGVVRPISEKVELKSPVAESIALVFAQEGSSLKKGDTILLLNTTSVDASLSNQRSLLKNMDDQLADLQTLSSQYSTSFRSENRKQEQLLFQRQKEEFVLSIEAADKKLKRNEPLFRSGVIPQDEFENYQHEKLRLERELKTLTESRMSVWKSDLNELRQQREESLALIRKLEQERQQHVVTSPVQGSLEECYLQPKDIGFLHLSMKVSVLVEAFDYNQWGKLNGQVSDISSDYILQNETPFYKVKCRIERPFLVLRNGKRGYLKKGMTVQTRFMVNRRSLFHLIYEKMDDWTNPLNR